MGVWRKILLGGLGFTLGGPIGAIVGLLIANAIDNSNAIGTDEPFVNSFSSSPHYTREQSANDFRIAFLVMFAAVMKADGETKKSELDVVKRFLVNNYGEDGALEALQLLKGLLNQQIDVTAVSQQCADNMNYSTRIHLLHLLYTIAAADGYIDEREVTVIEQIGAGMRVTAADLNSIKAMFQPRQDDKRWAYDILELQPGASQDDIKKAYRRMAMKYHPDKVAALGEEAKATATEKFRKVKEAYDALI